MATPTTPVDLIDHEAINRAHEVAFREAVLEHARMGRPVSVVRNNQIVWLSPEEVFAEYGLDENGKPPTVVHAGQPAAESGAVPLNPQLRARLENRAALDQQWEEGKLKEYEGEYIISDGETVFAHGRWLIDVWENAQQAVRAAGRQPEQLTEYFVMRS